MLHNQQHERLIISFCISFVCLLLHFHPERIFEALSGKYLSNSGAT